ncbi:MAG: PASTA domain-containing protein [Candidatus Korobacteraceae bacterium]|jgi:beta-lactam-binding protein with PASTA domain
MRIFRGLLYALILVLVGLASALTAMRFAIHGREVSVPKVVGLTPADAQKLAGESGLHFSAEQRFYSSAVAEGRIVSQLPAAGTRVRVGYQLRVAESLGPQKAEIPNLLGQSQRSAELNLRRRGLELGTVAQLATADSAPEQVVAQSPTPDAQQISTPAVSVLLSAPPAPEQFVMPDFAGSSLSEATATVRGAGLTLGPISNAPAASATPAAPAGQNANLAQRSSEAVIARQTPAPGQRVTAGTTVTFEITPQ